MMTMNDKDWKKSFNYHIIVIIIISISVIHYHGHFDAGWKFFKER